MSTFDYVDFHCRFGVIQVSIYEDFRNKNFLIMGTSWKIYVNYGLSGLPLQFLGL